MSPEEFDLAGFVTANFSQPFVVKLRSIRRWIPKGRCVHAAARAFFFRHPPRRICRERRSENRSSRHNELNYSADSLSDVINRGVTRKRRHLSSKDPTIPSSSFPVSSRTSIYAYVKIVGQRVKSKLRMTRFVDEATTIRKMILHSREKFYRARFFRNILPLNSV